MILPSSLIHLEVHQTSDVKHQTSYWSKGVGCLQSKSLFAMDIKDIAGLSEPLKRVIDCLDKGISSLLHPFAYKRAERVKMLIEQERTDKNAITEQGWINADCNGANDGVSNNDALAIQMYLLGKGELSSG